MASLLSTTDATNAEHLELGIGLFGRLVGLGKPSPQMRMPSHVLGDDAHGIVELQFHGVQLYLLISDLPTKARQLSPTPAGSCQMVSVPIDSDSLIKCSR